MDIGMIAHTGPAGCMDQHLHPAHAIEFKDVKSRHLSSCLSHATSLRTLKHVGTSLLAAGAHWMCAGAHCIRSLVETEVGAEWAADHAQEYPECSLPS
eukprot:1157965-Pelagomonas_calceolata.AAC.8